MDKHIAYEQISAILAQLSPGEAGEVVFSIAEGEWDLEQDNDGQFVFYTGIVQEVDSDEDV